MAVGKGSIKRAANAAGTPGKGQAARQVPEAGIKERKIQDIHEEKFRAVTSLKDDMPVYLL